MTLTVITSIIDVRTTICNFEDFEVRFVALECEAEPLSHLVDGPSEQRKQPARLDSLSSKSRKDDHEDELGGPSAGVPRVEHWDQLLR